MIAQKLYDAGFKGLVSVMPPDAEIAPGSRVDPSQRGKCPGVLTQNGWTGYPFTQRKIAPETIDRWGANIGLLGDNFPGLDIDVDDEQLSRVVVKQAKGFFGPSVVRSSVGSRKLLVYRTDKPFARMALKIKYRGVEHTVEVLGKGRQYVVDGRHPSGNFYGWDLPPWVNSHADDLVHITKEDVSQFFEHLTTVLGDRATCTVVGDGKESDENAPPQEDLLAPSTEVLEALVASIPNASECFPERDDYIRFGHAVKGAGGDISIFLDWASRWDEGHNDPDVVIADWNRMHAPFRVGWDYLQSLAQDLTDYEPAQDVFETMADAAPPPEPPVVLTDERQVDYSDEWAVATILPRLKADLRFVPSGEGDKGIWFLWAGHKWAEDGALQHERLIRAQLRRLALVLRDRANVAPTDKVETALRATAKRFQSSAGIQAVIRLLKAYLAASLSDFDQDRWALNTPGGVVDLRTGETAPIEHGALFARSTTVAPKKGRMPLWSKFMHDLTGGDKDLIRFLQKLMGYCLTGDVSEKVLAFAWGSDSDTGKSTFIRAMADLFGDYADSVDVEAFISARVGSRVPDDIARLPGARLVTATEPTAGQHWNEKTIKAITGGDEISARKLYRSWFTFKPQFKIFIVGNAQPSLKHVDDAMMRRILIVPMNYKVPREDQIEDLSCRIAEEEGAAVLHWLVQGCLAWMQEGLEPPTVVREQTERYKAVQDVLQLWIDEECILSEDGSETRRDLYQSFSIWCNGGGHKAGSETMFKANMDARASELGIEDAQVGTGRRRGYKGITLRVEGVGL